MRLLALVLSFLAIGHELTAQDIADIAKRKACSQALFVDFPVPLSAVGDSARLLTAVVTYQPGDTFPSFLMTFDSTGRLDTLQQGQEKPLVGPVNDSLLAALRLGLHDSPPQYRPLRVTLRRLPGTAAPQLALEPVAPTCQPEIIDAKKTLKRLVSGLFDLRNNHRRKTPVYAKLTVAFVVHPDSTLSRFRVLRSSDFPHVDSMTIAVLSRARYAPGAVGRRAVPMWVQQGVSFKAEH